MGQCPFCKGAVDTDVLVTGGTCSHCLIEIPGEEAPTNPGVQAIARQHAEEAAASSGRGRLLAVAALLVLGAVGGGAWWSTKNTPTQLVELDEESFSPIPLAAHQNIYDESTDAVPTTHNAAGGSKSSASGARSSGTASSGTASSGTASSGTASSGTGMLASGSASSSGTHSPATGGQLAQGSAGDSSPGRATLNPAAGSIAKQVEDVDPTAASSTPGMMMGPSITVGSRDAAESLTDPKAIADMIKRVVSRNSRQLQDCYNDRLKTEPDLQGRWRVGFEVQKDGTVSKISVTHLTQANGELELCMSGKLTRWRFQRIASPQGVSKNFSFTH